MNRFGREPLVVFVLAFALFVISAIVHEPLVMGYIAASGFFLCGWGWAIGCTSGRKGGRKTL